MKTKLAMTDIKSELSDTKFELNKAKLDLKATTDDLNDTKANIKATLANTESKLTDTNNQLASALQRISSLEVLLYLATDKVIVQPTSGAVVLESSVRWPDKLAVMAIMSKSSDQKCPVILRMSQFNKQMKNNVEWYSDSFYTHDKGYKLCLRINAAGYGDGKGNHLSVFLTLMKGPHDDELTWPLRGPLEIKLLNQISDIEHHSKTNTFDAASSNACSRVTGSVKARSSLGCVRFMPYRDLHKTTPTCQYLKDDCLFFQVTKL